MFRRHTLRCWAAQVLLVWLFCVGVGVAHACLASDTLAPAVAQGAGTLQADCHGLQAGDESPAWGDNCQDFCDKAQLSVPLHQQALDDAHALALPVLVCAAALPLPAAAAPPWRTERWPSVPTPPIPIALLRLTR